MVVIISNKKRMSSYICFFLAGILMFGSYKALKLRSVETLAEYSPAYIAIIIDDFGNNTEGTKEMLSLPIRFTGAVMPSMENTKEECQLLYENEKGVILHMPMQAHHGKQSWLGSTPILNDYSNELASEIFRNCLQQIDYISGVNNHMGSKVMENEELLTAILTEMKEKDLIFVDSLTTEKSKGEKVASELGIPYFKRDVFLDSTDSVAEIENNLLKTAEIAKSKGYAVAIGHVGSEGGLATYKAINNLHTKLESEGIKFVTIQELQELTAN